MNKPHFQLKYKAIKSQPSPLTGFLAAAANSSSYGFHTSAVPSTPHHLKFRPALNLNCGAKEEKQEWEHKRTKSWGQEDCVSWWLMPGRLLSRGASSIWTQGKGDKAAESHHTAGRGQQEAYQAMLHKGTQGISSMSQTKHKMALGLINTGLPRLMVVINTCLHYPTNRVQNNKYIFNETLTQEYKEKKKKNRKWVGQGREESQKSRPISYFGWDIQGRESCKT